MVANDNGNCVMWLSDAHRRPCSWHDVRHAQVPSPRLHHDKKPRGQGEICAARSQLGELVPIVRYTGYSAIGGERVGISPPLRG